MDRNKKPRIQLESLEEGQLISGKVTSVTTYGAFVDFGARNDGLVHISQLSHSFVRDVNDVVQVGQAIECKVLSVDLEKGRTSLSLKGLNGDEENVSSSQTASNKSIIIFIITSLWLGGESPETLFLLLSSLLFSLLTYTSITCLHTEIPSGR